MDSYQEKSLSYGNYGDLTDIKNAVIQDAVIDTTVKKPLVEQKIGSRSRPTTINVSSYSMSTLRGDSYVGASRNDIISFEEDTQSPHYIAVIDQDKRVTIEASEKPPDKLFNPPNVQRQSYSQPTTSFFTTDYIGQFYVASLTVIGLYVMFRIIKPTKI